MNFSWFALTLFCAVALAMPAKDVQVIESSLVMAPPRAPVSSSDNIFVLVFAPGVHISPVEYKSLLAQIQQKLVGSVQLWIGIAKQPFDITLTQGQFESSIADTLDLVYDTMYADPATHLPKSEVRVIFAGHSRGCINTQDMIKRAFGASPNGGLMFQNKAQVAAGASTLDRIREYKNAGLIMLSGGLQRKYRPDQLGSFLNDPQYPMLSMSGELDGLFRVFRLAESHYHDNHGRIETNNYRQLNWVVRGASHMSFAGGKAPIFVKFNDLKSEIQQEEAQELISSALADFIKYLQFGDVVLPSIKQRTAESQQFFAPIIQALDLEGSHHFKPPCNELDETDKRRTNHQCWVGSLWSEQSQEVLSGLPDPKFKVTDAFWKVWLINPVHLPEVHSQCDRPDKTCFLNVTTVTQLTYSLIDPLDTGLTAISADEMRVKMKSRQSVQFNAGLKNANFTLLDDNNFVCKELNERALEYAYKLADPSSLDRFNRYGDRLVMGEDVGPFNAGPSWIWKSLKWDTKGRLNETDGKWYVEVRSPTMRTPQDYFIKLSAGFHYCKLLSPARALEWIYIDSLRRKMGLRAQ